MLEILEVEVLASVSGFRVVRGDSGVDLVVEREAVMVEVWPRLGGELGEVLRLLGALVWMKGKKRKRAVLQWEEEGVLVLSALWILSLFLWRSKGR